MRGPSPRRWSHFWVFAGIVVLTVIGTALVWMMWRVDQLEEQVRQSGQSPRLQVIEQEGLLVKGRYLDHGNSSGFAEFERPFDAPPVIVVFEEPPKEYAELAAKEYSTGIKQHLVTPIGPESDGDRATWSVGRQVKTFEKRMSEYSGNFQFRPTSTGFGWSIDYSKYDLPQYPFPFPVVDGSAVTIRTLRWRARGIKVIENERK